jgi:putative two-component system response regulator
MSHSDDRKDSGAQILAKNFSHSFPFPDGTEEEVYYRNKKILIVDDEKGIRTSLKLYLESTGFLAEEAKNGEDALGLLQDNHYFLCLTDITMPCMGGIELLEHVKKMNREVDVVMITGHMDIDYAIDAIKQGAFDYFKKPFLFEDLRVTIMRVIEKQTLRRKSLELERLKERQHIETKNLAEFMIALAGIIDAKSPYTRQHSDRVSMFSKKIAELINLDEGEIQRISLGAKLHDIGKIGTPEYILDKAGPLSDEEFEIIKQHPAKGADLIGPISSLKDLTDIIHFHHEDLDGTGYPEGLQGNDIPLAPRIVRIADYWDAITSHRPYRKPMSYEKATSILRSESNKKVDGDLLQIFFDYLEKNRA